MSNGCPVCKSALNVSTSRIERPGNQFFECPRCGEFYLSETALYTIQNKLDNENKVVVLSHAIRKMKHRNIQPILTDAQIESILKSNKVPSHREQADNLILWLGENSIGFGENVKVAAEWHISEIGSKTIKGFRSIIEYLKSTSLVDGDFDIMSNTGYFQLTFKGWDHYDQLKKGTINGRKAFMAMKFEDPGLDNMFSTHFVPAVDKTGFELVTLNDSKRAGLIDDRLRVDIMTSRFLIADLTHDNNGAYWEAGFAEGLGKPVIYTCEKEKFEKLKTHFDTNHHLTIKWDANEPHKAVEDLKSTIRATLPAEAKLIDD
ncbi:hypothetical protein BAC1_01254 [uncultured bacterium]|nr:hypothetical protein BAC1_01254 [uncultured bacterium]